MAKLFNRSVVRVFRSVTDFGHRAMVPISVVIFAAAVAVCADQAPSMTWNFCQVVIAMLLVSGLVLVGTAKPRSVMVTRRRPRRK
ncbi:MAG: hypothetical protein F8N36_14390 [Desulfovibrio sp.]|uniref:hypothetical protein n=1 Tax=Desulfovibrio sp. TaxID=885 RepID=UPI00135E72C5|nr:hypothetical protein [Desulfovibrio sp.]MTJ94027.1 hypothetical protein [Desulfovibrio sp.]